MIRGNTLRYVDYGIVISGDEITVERNSVEHIAGDGIVCSANNASLLHNTIKYFYKVSSNHDDGIQFHRGRDKTTPIYNAVVHGNSVIAWDNAMSNPLIGSPHNPRDYNMHHKQSSPAINAGSITLAPGIDIDGVRRPQGEGIDVGPYEFEAVSVPADSRIR